VADSQQTVLATERVKLSSLSPYPGNPRVGDIDLIRQSVRDHGQFRAMVANRRTKQVLAGNHLLHALLAEGHTEGLVHWVDVDEVEAAKIVLVDNRTSDLARYDDGLLAKLLQELPTIEGTGWNDSDLEALISRLESEVVLDPASGSWSGAEQNVNRHGDASTAGQPLGALREVLLVFTIDEHAEFKDMVARLIREEIADTASGVVLAALRGLGKAE